jgi:uncharacterized protein (DUF488 family)
MQTSYFAKSSKLHNAVSISLITPSGFKGKVFNKLAPKYSFFKKYKEDGDQVYYTERYYKEVLNNLDPKKVFEELGHDAVLLCYEAPEKFCHRHIVAQWFYDKIGIRVTEIPKQNNHDTIISEKISCCFQDKT